MHSEFIVIVAAGTGSRFGASLPKQFCCLAGEPVLIHTLRNIKSLMPDAVQVLVISREMEELWLKLCKQYNFDSPEYVFGGSTRYHSVKAAITHLAFKAGGSDIVYIHDAARPLLCQQVIERLRAAVTGNSCIGAIPTVPLADSIRVILPDGTSQAVDRNQYRAVQTPQAFLFSNISRAYESCEYMPSFTDDASVAEHYFNRPVTMVEGSPLTLKITTARDMAFVYAAMNHDRTF